MRRRRLPRRQSGCREAKAADVHPLGIQPCRRPGHPLGVQPAPPSTCRAPSPRPSTDRRRLVSRTGRSHTRSALSGQFAPDGLGTGPLVHAPAHGHGIEQGEAAAGLVVGGSGPAAARHRTGEARGAGSVTSSRVRPPTAARLTRIVTGTPSPRCRMTFVSSSLTHSWRSAQGTPPRYSRTVRRTPGTASGVARRSRVSRRIGQPPCGGPRPALGRWPGCSCPAR